MKAVIFDNDGVVTFSDEMYSAKLKRDRNAPSDQVDQFFINTFVPYCMTGKADLKDEFSKKLPEWGITDSAETILDEWFKSENNVDNNIVVLIHDLKSRGIKCYMATNQEIYRTKYMLNEMGFDSLFDKVYSSAELGVKKPDPKFYEIILNDLEKEGIKASDIMYLDDSEKNVKVSREMGIPSILYKDYKSFTKEHIL